jgi:hypothetical protein
LRDIRAYRNRLVQGRVVPQWDVRVYDVGTGAFRKKLLMYPRMDKVEDYLDWRPVFDPANVDAIPPDSEEAASIVRQAWERVLLYCETSWRRHLL